MKTFFAALIIISVGIATSFAANNMMMLHVGSSGSTGVVPPPGCQGGIDLSAGCPLPMLGVF